MGALPCHSTHQGRAAGARRLAQPRGSSRCLTRSVGQGERPELPSVTAPSGSCDRQHPPPSPGDVWPEGTAGPGVQRERVARHQARCLSLHGMRSPVSAEVLSREIALASDFTHLFGSKGGRQLTNPGWSPPHVSQAPPAAGLCAPACWAWEGPASASPVPPLHLLHPLLAAIVHPCRDDSGPSWRAAPQRCAAPLTISMAPAQAALQLLSRHTTCLVVSACCSTYLAVPVTQPYPSPSRTHHPAVSITAAR